MKQYFLSFQPLTSIGSVFLPNDFYSLSSDRAGRYIVLNMSINLILHLVLWLTMMFFCWECTKILDEDFRKLRVCFPVTISLWLANLMFTIATWRLCLKKSIEERHMLSQSSLKKGALGPNVTVTTKL